MAKNNILFFKVLELLKERKMTQTELAKLAGISQPSLSKILSGRHETKTTTTKRIAKALKVPVSYLIDDSQKNFENTGIIGNNNSNNQFNVRDIELQLKDHEIRLLKLENELLKKQIRKEKWKK